MKYSLLLLLAPMDTLRKSGESSIQYCLRLQQSIVIYVPVEKVVREGREVYKYYVVGGCYPPSSDKCVESEIANGRYGVIYFDIGMGFTGYCAGDSF